MILNYDFILSQCGDKIKTQKEKGVRSMKKVIKYLPGMAIALVLAAAAKGLEALEKAAGLHFIGASVIALFLGMIIDKVQ